MRNIGQLHIQFQVMITKIKIIWLAVFLQSMFFASATYRKPGKRVPKGA